MCQRPHQLYEAGSVTGHTVCMHKIFYIGVHYAAEVAKAFYKLPRYPGGILLGNAVKKQHFKKLFGGQLFLMFRGQKFVFKSFTVALMMIFGQIQLLLNFILPKEEDLCYSIYGDFSNEKFYRWKKRCRKTAG